MFLRLGRFFRYRRKRPPMLFAGSGAVSGFGFGNRPVFSGKPARGSRLLLRDCSLWG